MPTFSFGYEGFHAFLSTLLMFTPACKTYYAPLFFLEAAFFVRIVSVASMRFSRLFSSIVISSTCSPSGPIFANSCAFVRP
jgi:hypothetical protein